MKKAILTSLLVSSIVVGCEKEDTSKEASSNTANVQKEDKENETKKIENSSNGQQTPSTEKSVSVQEETPNQEDSYMYAEKQIEKLSKDVKNKRSKFAASTPVIAINDESVVEILGIALMDSKEEVESKLGKEDFINNIIINQQQKEVYSYTIPVKNNKGNIHHYRVALMYDSSPDFDQAVFEIEIGVNYDKKAKPTYGLPEEFWKNFTGSSYVSDSVGNLRFYTEDQLQQVDIVPTDTNAYRVTAKVENTTSGKGDLTLFKKAQGRTEIEKYMNYFNRNK